MNLEEDGMRNPDYAQNIHDEILQYIKSIDDDVELAEKLTSLVFRESAKMHDIVSFDLKNQTLPPVDEAE